MNYRIKTSKSFDKEIKRLGKHYASIANDYAALLDELAQNPRLGIDLGSGLRKIRMQITSKGKWWRKGHHFYCYCIDGRKRN
mgnify:CR=1 FL=1